MNDNIDRWKSLHDQPRFCPLYPHEQVVSWTFRSFPRGQAPSYHLLDLGCGAGRHAVFWANEGYCVTAADPSESGASVARERLSRYPEANVRVFGADAIEYPDASFDGVLCYAVLYYLDYAGMKKAVSEIHRVLKPGGMAMIVTRTTEDSRFCNAVFVDERTCRLGEVIEGGPSTVESGMLMTPLDHAGVKEVYSDFNRLEIDRMTVTSANGTFIDDDWIVKVVK